ncbi:MAG TPA: heparin lyase I family protein [Polyangiales bacterium]|nr:heparin lyase I family protein [Polyangiales bacterium]
MPDETGPVASSWSTGFEDEFCDYEQVGGFCYAGPSASYTTVTTPVHSGHSAAAFEIVAGDTGGHQTRCVRQGMFPATAYYGAWYFIPATATNMGNWNLLHFRGGTPSDQHGLWDVSLINGANGELEAVLLDFLNGTTRRATQRTPVPIGRWFHLELYLKRAADATGEVALYQDDEVLLEAKGLVTDDTSWGQWYVGNLATRLTPRDSTLYVDDVTIRSTR